MMFQSRYLATLRLHTIRTEDTCMCDVRVCGLLNIIAAALAHLH